MKRYNLLWLQEDGAIQNLGDCNTKYPKQFLANEVAKMIVLMPSTFAKLKFDTIIKNIHQGKTQREHYFVEIDGCFGIQTLSLIEQDWPPKS